MEQHRRLPMSKHADQPGLMSHEFLCRNIRPGQDVVIIGLPNGGTHIFLYQCSRDPWSSKDDAGAARLQPLRPR